MRVALYQMDVAWLDPNKNLEKIITNCREISKKSVDLLVLPEMFSVGYILDTSLINHSWQHTIIQTLTELCYHSDLTIMGSIPFFNQGRWTNTMITVNKTGLVHQYDKVHLFSPVGEHVNYSSGNLATIWTYENWKLLPLICYDLRFPYLSFSEQFPHLLIYAANWPDSRISHWDTLLKARAIENQCYVIGVNRVGNDKNGAYYPGHSSLYDFEGNLVSSLGSFENLVVLDLNLNNLQMYRVKLPFFNDRLNFS